MWGRHRTTIIIPRLLEFLWFISISIPEVAARTTGQTSYFLMSFFLLDHDLLSSAIHSSATQWNDRIWVFSLLFCALFSANEQMIYRSCPGEIPTWSLSHQTREHSKSYAGKFKARLIWEGQDQSRFFLLVQKTICPWKHHQWKWEMRN